MQQQGPGDIHIEQAVRYQVEMDFITFVSCLHKQRRETTWERD